MAATSKFLRYFQTSTGVPLVGPTLYLVPQANTYPTGALQLTAHETRDGVYYRNNVPDGEYKIYISIVGDPTEHIEIYEQNIWVGENKLSLIGQHFDVNDSHRLTTNGIQDDAVTNQKLAAYAVSEVSLADDAVSSRIIADGAVGADHLAEDSVTTAKIADYAVTTEKIDFDAVTGNQLNDGAVTGGKIAVSSINRSHIVNGEVTTVHYENGSITGEKIANGSIGTPQLDAESVTGEKIANGTITGDKLADDAVTNTKIAAYSVSEVSLADDAVTARIIGDGEVQTNHLSNGAVNGSKLQDLSVSTQHLVSGSVINTKLENGRDYLRVSANGGGVDGTPRQIGASAAYVSNSKLQVRPGTNGDSFEVLDASGNVLLAINTVAKTVDVKSGVKLTGDGSLLTGIVSMGTTGGTSSATNLEIQADSDANGSGDIIFKLGSKIVARIPNAYGAGLAAGVEGSYFINTAVNTIYNGWGGIPAAYIMDGVDDYVSVGTSPHNSFTQTDEFSIEAVFMQTALLSGVNASAYIIGKANKYGIGIHINNNRLYAGIRATADRSTYDNNISIELNKLYHIILVYKGSNSSFSINGVTTNIDLSGSGLTDGTGELRMGDYNLGGNRAKFPGIIHFTRLYNRALSATEVSQRWNNGVPYLYRLEWRDRNANNTSINTTPTTIGANWTDNGNGSYTCAGSGGDLYRAMTFQRGKRYRRSITVTGRTNGVLYALYDGNNTAMIIDGNGTFSDEIVAPLNWQGLFFIGSPTSTFNGTISNITFTPIGCNGEWTAENAGAMGWVEGMNGLHGNTSGFPIAPNGLRDYRSGIINANTELTRSQKAQTILVRVIATNTDGSNARTISIGTTNGGTDLVNAQSIPAGQTVVISVGAYSATERSLYAAANGSSVNLQLIYERVAQ